jgi:hypothetical protein
MNIVNLRYLILTKNCNILSALIKNDIIVSMDSKGKKLSFVLLIIYVLKDSAEVLNMKEFI